MDSARWTRIQTLFEKVADLPEQEAKEQLEQMCGNEPELYSQVLTLLNSDRNVHPVLNTQFIRNLVDAPPKIRVGDTLGRYSIIEQAAEGGMSHIFKAKRADLKRTVALKVLKKGMDSDKITERFKQEQHILAQLKHPNIVPIYDVGQTRDGRPWFSMEWVEGLPLLSYCNQNRLSIQQRIHLFLSICEVINYAHRNLVIHRDLKPGNILVTPSGQVKLLDFGIAKVLEETTEEAAFTQQNNLVLTPEYAAPEQFKVHAPTVALDIYQLGIILFELLNGTRPFNLKEKSLFEIPTIISNTAPKQLYEVEKNGPIAAERSVTERQLATILRSDLNPICHKAIRPEPEQRYLTVQSFHNDLQRFLQKRPVQARRGSTWYKISTFSRRNGKAIGLTLLVLISLSALIGYYTNAVKKERDKAQLEAMKTAQVSDFLVNLFEISDPEKDTPRTLNAGMILEQGRKNVKQELKSQPLVQAGIYTVLGRIYNNLAQYDTARVLLKKAIFLTQKYNQEPELTILKQKLNLAYGYLEQDSWQHATLLVDSIINDPILKGQTHALFKAGVLTFKGQLLYRQRLYTASKPFFEQSLSLYQSQPDKNLNDVAGVYNDLALNLKRLGDYLLSEQYQRASLQIKQELYGQQHILLSTEYFNLAKLLHVSGRHNQADSLFKIALNLERKQHISAHPDIAKVLTSYAFLKKDMRQLEKAQKLIDEAYDINIQFYDKINTNIATNLDFKARLYRYSKKYDLALSYHKKALEIKQALYGLEHTSISNTINNIARVYHAMGNLAKAEENYRASYKMKRKFAIEEDPDLATVLHNLALTVYDLGRYEESLKLLKNSRLAQTRLHHPSHKRVLGEMDNIAFNYIKLDSLTKAEMLFREALEIRTQSLKQGHRYIARNKSWLGYSLFKQQKFSAAEKLYLEALKELTAASGIKNRHTQKTVGYLSELYNETKQLRKKAKYDSLVIR